MSAQDIIVVAETNQDGPADITLELLTGARQLADSTGGQVTVLVLGGQCAGHAEALSAADRIVIVDDAQLAAFSPGPYLAVLADLVASASPCAVLVGSTSIGLDLGPALAARLDAPIVVGCQAIEVQGETLRVTSSLCGGKILGDVEISAAPAVLMVLPGSFRRCEQSGQAQVETRSSPVALQGGAIRFEKMILPEAGDVDITQEDTLVAVGRGIQQEDDIEVAEELAKVLSGQLCASRPIVDQGWLPMTRQVGKSGMTVKPKCFVTLGVSGASEHVEGMKDAELIIAVNTDADAPIFNVAHYGVVGDLLDFAPALTEAIKARASA